MNKTYPRVIALLREKEKETGSVNAIVKRTGLTHNTITNYLAGRAEPTQASLEKISAAYGPSVAWLREDSEKDTRPQGTLNIADLSPVKRKLWKIIEKLPDEKATSLLALLEQ